MGKALEEWPYKWTKMCRGTGYSHGISLFRLSNAMSTRASFLIRAILLSGNAIIAIGLRKIARLSLFGLSFNCSLDEWRWWWGRGARWRFRSGDGRLACVPEVSRGFLQRDRGQLSLQRRWRRKPAQQHM